MKNSLILAIALLIPTALLVPAYGVAANYKANLNDAQIAAIAVAANQVDINAGKAAESKSSNSEVKAFAHLIDYRLDLFGMVEVRRNRSTHLDQQGLQLLIFCAGQ